MRYKSVFKDKVEELVAQIPSGRVMTYGQIAAFIGHPRAARQVGGTAHYGNPDLPWHRVVNTQGGLASGYPGGRAVHRQHLEAEGVVFNEAENPEGLIDLDQYVWRPNKA